MMDANQFMYHYLEGDFNPFTEKMKSAARTMIEEVISYGYVMTDFSIWNFSDNELKQIVDYVNKYFAG